MAEPPPALPPRVRLLHVGFTKTGTTALQSAAGSRRHVLLRHGVRYPGTRYNHRQAAFAVLDRTRRLRTKGPDEWDRLLAEVADEHARRIFISNEFIADWDDAVARRFVEDLGLRTHIAFTVRSFALSLPSVWQQYVKAGYREDFEHFLSVILAEDPDPVELPPNFERHDQGRVVTRWAQIVGPENVTVVVVDKERPTQISTAFEALLDLPSGTLNTSTRRVNLNRSLSAAEASLLLAVNRTLEPYGVAQEDQIRILRSGATARILQECSARGEDQLVMPPWAAEAAAARGRHFATVITDLGVKVVGDPTELSRVPESSCGRWTMPESVPVDVAAQALVGALSGGLHRGSNFGLPARARPRSWVRSVARLLSLLRPGCRR